MIALEAEAARAAEALRAGDLVILPTETVYGLAADAANPAAIARIFEAKGRPRFNPLIAHVTDRAMAERIAPLPPLAARLAEAFWPGPLTLVVPYGGGDAVCDLARAGLDTVALRAPAHPDGAGGDRGVRRPGLRALRQPFRPPEPHHLCRRGGGDAARRRPWRWTAGLARSGWSPPWSPCWKMRCVCSAPAGWSAQPSRR